MSFINTSSSTYAVLNYNLKQLEVGVTALDSSTPKQSLVGELVRVDTTANTVDVLPPENASPGDKFYVVDARGNAATNNITVDFVAGGYNLAGVSANDVISTDYELKSYLYIDSVAGWFIL